MNRKWYTPNFECIASPNPSFQDEHLRREGVAKTKDPILYMLPTQPEDPQTFTDDFGLA